MKYRSIVVHLPRILAFGSLLVMLGLLALLKKSTEPDERPPPASPTLTLYCAMGVNQPVREIIKKYEEQTGVLVRVTFDGSKKLFVPMRLDQRADLYLAADASYLEDAEKAGLPIRKVFPVATQRPVVVVSQGNPLAIQSIDDLTKPGVRLYLPSPRLAAIGKVAQTLLGPMRWQKLWNQKITACETVAAVAQHVNLDSHGAGILWDANVQQYPYLEWIRIPEFEKNPSEIVIAILEKSKQPDEAERFARFLIATDQGLRILKQAGYDPVEGQPGQHDSRH